MRFGSGLRQSGRRFAPSFVARLKPCPSRCSYASNEVLNGNKGTITFTPVHLFQPAYSHLRTRT
jgi:hypothetical protein